VKYAGATFAEVRVVEDEEESAIVIEVHDDGIGGADPARGSGIEGLVDRIRDARRHVRAREPAGGGTRVRATIPTAPRVLPL
jgi:signal transduction histidine kinase